MRTAKSPPKPTAPAVIVSHTCTRVRALSSWRADAVGFAGADGTNARTSTAVRSDSPATGKNAERHPRCWPIQVAAGTPTTLATDRPRITWATARPFAVRGCHSGGDQRGDAEVGAVRQPCGEPRHGQRREAVHQSGGRIRHGMDGQQAQQQRATWQSRAEQGDERGSDDHAERREGLTLHARVKCPLREPSGPLVPCVPLVPRTRWTSSGK